MLSFPSAVVLAKQEFKSPWPAYGCMCVLFANNYKDLCVLLLHWNVT